MVSRDDPPRLRRLRLNFHTSCSQQLAVAESFADGKINATVGSANALLNQISAQAGKKLTLAQAAELTEGVNALIAALR